ncbi:serpin family protein [Polaribacter sp. Hel1_85]|uniref:serpin family protein n=1 Tax=Polaribacter sp. Hel1_85 TaxID=1250005 RepID=UPI00052E2B6C|nr:serpin family protein [Polaribacter sp. Hel1_85]KGL62540.1 serine protease inhibitor (serpin family) [Polaribacter sp. Hel1_85]
MKKNVLIKVLFIVVLQSCSSTLKEKEPFNTIPKSEKFIESNNKFAFDIFKNIATTETNENFMISPVSLSLAIGMVYNGAESETKIAFENTLNYTDFLPNEINEINREISLNLSDNSVGSLFEIANSIWVEKTFSVKEDFINTNKNYYNAEVENLDFSDANSINIINNWVSGKTHQKIPTIIETISPTDVMFLINALYFKSDWKYKFEEENTKEIPFYGANSTENVEMMNLTNDLLFYENTSFSAVKLPYKNDKYTMTVILPKENKTTTDIINLLNTDNWKSWTENFKNQAINLTIPKFKSSYQKILNETLIDLGLGNAFSTNANFNGISDVSLKISYVLQKTFIEVNEKGTEAAAVTVVGIETTSTQPNKEMIINKPFLYTITEKETGSICFLGKIGMPKDE